VIPPLRIGNFALDLSFLIVLVGAYVLLRVNRMVFLS
jgi:YggT family protein